MRHTIFYLFIITAAASCKMGDTSIFSENTKIEQKYTTKGNYAVSTADIKYGNKRYKAYYPTQVNAKSPVITWGNGTGQTPKTYDQIFTHLASWGFIVIDNYEESTIDGASILESAKVMLQENLNAKSVFYQKVDTRHIGAAGHSQGAGGVVNAYKNFSDGKIITTIAPLAFPSILKPTGTGVKVPIFFISGEKDDIFSSLKYNKQSYDEVPSSIPAAKAARRGTFHELLTNNGLATGYLTAWMRFQLLGDKEAAKAFIGPSPEISLNPNWNNVATKNLR